MHGRLKMQKGIENIANKIVILWQMQAHLYTIKPLIFRKYTQWRYDKDLR